MMNRNPLTHRGDSHVSGRRWAPPQRAARRRPQNATHSRAGVATVWVILFVPAIFTLLVIVTDIANVWMARVELTNALEAGALAGVEEWANGATTSETRTIVQQYAKANTVIGQPVNLGKNENLANPPNDNATCSGDIILGSVSGTSFDAGTAPTTTFGVRAQKTITVSSLWKSLFGFTPGPYKVSSHAIAQFDLIANKPQLVHIDTYTCP